MSKAVIREEVIEEENNFTFINGEYVEVKQEEIEQKPENLLEQKIKMESIELFKNNNSDRFLEDVERKPKEIDYKIEKEFIGDGALSCKICKKIMPRSLLKLIMSEEDKTVLSEYLQIKGSLETRASYVCVAHIQMIIRENDIKVKITKKPLELLMRSFVSRNQYLMQVNKN
ncbi:hypothetical protein B9Z55_021071 [Caenorhabditis nigoni]|uniref:Uncharacterized protein n=1 Tax=Caenorhabditis nigoni TaxID=1611254 RepID=A0A2G5TR86_9PELO|nr:hypothetical protein B9Z55_021071 [Caenorhabditis nigoni]